MRDLFEDGSRFPNTPAADNLARAAGVCDAAGDACTEASTSLRLGLTITADRCMDLALGRLREAKAAIEAARLMRR